MSEPIHETSDLPVTVVISRWVKPGKEAEFEAFLAGVNAACMKYEGHMGSNIFRPSNSASSEYRIIFKFDCLSNLLCWEASEERRRWFTQAEALTQSPPLIQVLTGLETWFTLPGQSTLTPPPRHKMALVSWLAVFPLITTITTVLQDQLNPLPIVLRALTVTAIAIPAMTYVLMPQMTRLFAWWLYPTPTQPLETQGNTGLAIEPGQENPLPELQPIQPEMEVEGYR